jgi:hypothetical protein
MASFDASGGLFSSGLTVERTTMNLFKMSNQKGAPSEIPNAVTTQPKIISRIAEKPIVSSAQGVPGVTPVSSAHCGSGVGHWDCHDHPIGNP